MLVADRGHGADVILDTTGPSFSPEQIQAAQAAMVKRAGPLVQWVEESVEQSWAPVRGELNQVAGGRASARVMILAHHARRAHEALELTSLLAKAAAGEDKEGAAKALRNTAGLSVVATDLLNKAYAAAREDAAAAQAAQGGPVNSLMGRLGITATGHQPPGGHGLGAAPPTPTPVAGDERSEVRSPLPAPGTPFQGTPGPKIPQSPESPPSGFPFPKDKP